MINGSHIRSESLPKAVLAEAGTGREDCLIVCRSRWIFGSSTCGASISGNGRLVFSFAQACAALIDHSYRVVVLVESGGGADAAQEASVLAHLANGAQFIRLELPASKRPGQGEDGIAAATPGHGKEEWPSRPTAHLSPTVAFGDVVADRRTGRVFAKGDVIPFSPSESALFWALIDAPNRTANCRELIAALPSPQDETGARGNLRALILKVRLKLRTRGNPVQVVSVAGGYSIVSASWGAKQRKLKARASVGAEDAAIVEADGDLERQAHSPGG